MLWPVICLSLGLGYCAGHRETPALPPLPDSVLVQQVRLETLYVRDTQTFWRTKTRWDTVVLSVDRWKTDTLRVVEYVQLADSSLRACASALRTCEQRLELERRKGQHQLGVVNDSLRTARRDRWLWGAAGVGVGVVLNALRP
jgi:hypothetical protein